MFYELVQVFYLVIEPNNFKNYFEIRKKIRLCHHSQIQTHMSMLLFVHLVFDVFFLLCVLLFHFVMGLGWQLFYTANRSLHTFTFD